MGVHIGKLIRLRVEKLGMSKAEFARRMNRTPQTIQLWFKKPSMDTKTLENVSEVLGFNFFVAFVVTDKSYTSELQKGNFETLQDLPLDYQSGQLDELKSKLKQCEKERDYLKEINELLKEKD